MKSKQVVPQNKGNAYAWAVSFRKRKALCNWAEPTKEKLIQGGKPSDEAQAVRVAIIPVEYLSELTRRESAVAKRETAVAGRERRCAALEYNSQQYLAMKRKELGLPEPQEGNRG